MAVLAKNEESWRENEKMVEEKNCNTEARESRKKII